MSISPNLSLAIIRDPLVVEVNCPLVEAIAQMQAVQVSCELGATAVAKIEAAGRASCVLVVERGQLVGILTDRHILRLSFEPGWAETLTVAAVMQSPVSTLQEDCLTNFGAIAWVFQETNMRHLPILDRQGKLMGLLTQEGLLHGAEPTDLLRMRSVAEVMTTQVSTVLATTPLAEVIQCLTERQVGSVVVTEATEATVPVVPIGLITERDLVQCRALNLDPELYQAREVMNPLPFFARPRDSLWSIQQLIDRHGTHQVVVVDDHQNLCGIITATDLIRAVNPLELYRWAETLQQRVTNLEAAVTSRTQELQRVSHLQQRILDSTHFAIISIDPTGLIQTFNRGAAAMLGYDPEEIVGKQTPLLFHDPAEVAAIAEELSQTLQRPVSATIEVFQILCIKEGEQDREWTYITQAGDRKTVRLSLAPLQDADGQILGIAGIAQDMTQRKTYEDQLQATNLALARATRLKDEFLANMSHELRTPLNAILGMAEALKEEVYGPLQERQYRSVQTIEASGHHLLALINDILDLAKIEADRLEFHCEATAIADLCESSLVFVRHQAQEKQIRLHTDISAYLPKLFIDERRIRQVLINLLSNAIKFTPPQGTVSLEVSLKAIPSEATDALPRYELDFRVRDTGIGITPDNLTRLFQPFVQVDSDLNRQYSGTGLGLALVKKLVELHGGTVQVTSQLGVGSCFSFRLPCHNLLNNPQWSLELNTELPPDKPHPTAANSLDLAVVPPDLQGCRVLLTEDNEANILTTARYLTARGCQVIIARNGQEAIDLLLVERPDIILMDVQMPVLDGLTAIQRIRKLGDRQLAQTPIIAVTALVMPGDAEKCLAAGADNYLAKPMRLKQLTALIQETLALQEPL
ncbi:two-component hybrid sensor and regulator [[Synechococcus] sp. NIES-970]|nr:two-component hybrid sensor and regulator [[Synechococcus] sp. NIES-970]